MDVESKNSKKYKSRKVGKYKTKTKILNLFLLLFYFSTFLLFFTSLSFASNEPGLVRDANQLYNKGKIDEALKSYNEALTSAPEEPIINFNIGNSLYRKKQYKDAIAAYEKSLLSGDRKVEAKANYNIGNCKFRQGRFKEAVDCYKRAMELDPKDRDAKSNIEFIKKDLKKLFSKKKAGMGGDKQIDKLSKGNQLSQEQKQGSQKVYQLQQKQKTDISQAQKGGSKATSDSLKPGKEMSKEEAGVMLEDFRQQEQQDRQLRDKHAPQRYPDVDKDW